MQCERKLENKEKKEKEKSKKTNKNNNNNDNMKKKKNKDKNKKQNVACGGAHLTQFAAAPFQRGLPSPEQAHSAA
jgi:chromatin remodeling complex protein RSC6